MFFFVQLWMNCGNNEFAGFGKENGIYGRGTHGHKSSLRVFDRTIVLLLFTQNKSRLFLFYVWRFSGRKFTPIFIDLWIKWIVSAHHSDLRAIYLFQLWSLFVLLWFNDHLGFAHWNTHDEMVTSNTNNFNIWIIEMRQKSTKGDFQFQSHWNLCFVFLVPLNDSYS